MINVPHSLDRVFTRPNLAFTLKGNPHSEEVIAALKLQDRVEESVVFEDAAQIRAAFRNGHSPSMSVVLFDYDLGGKHFSPTTQSRPDENRAFPSWAQGAQWGVKVGKANTRPDRCARQVAADFFGHFEKRLEKGMFPWGNARKGESTPRAVELPAGMPAILQGLNDGPNLAAAIADQKFAMELPAGSRISWYRIPVEPLGCDQKALSGILDAFRSFEQASARLVRESPDVQARLMAGVEIPAGSPLREFYLFPPVDSFSVRRPDLHYTGDGVFASENDEMPGGFPELVHLDKAYGVNQERWHRCFRWLTESGPLLFLVSHEWSKCYVPEMRWLADHLRGQGYPVDMITTDQLDELSIRPDGVYHRGNRMATIWRQFPIFETKGKLVEIVEAAHLGRVRLIPEFAHFGNKAWFSVFRSHADFFRRTFESGEYGDAFRILDEVLPDSHLVQAPDCFPCVVAGMRVGSLDELRRLDVDRRDLLVLKICGANDMAARSYGVLMGTGLKDQEWRSWIDERIRLRQPFIVQRRLETGIARIPVLNTNRNCGELFHCRVLIRPWVIGPDLVSASACAVPTNTLRVHGRVDMAVAPVRLG